MRRLNSIAKQLFDMLASSFLILLLSPLFIFIAILIKLETKGNVFFTQDRVGKDGKLFKIIKFRTMLPLEYSFDKDGNVLENYSRVTKLGNLLRKTSLDELPQLFNIIAGTMSIIGPRPTLKYQVDKYNEFQRQRLQMKPGVTGWAQVNGRNDLTWEEKIKFDVYYVKNFNLMFDAKILIKTVYVVLFRKGVEFTKEDSISKEI